MVEWRRWGGRGRYRVLGEPLARGAGGGCVKSRLCDRSEKYAINECG